MVQLTQQKLVLSVLKNAEGNIIGFISVIRNITELKKIEVNLGESRFRELTDLLPIGYNDPLIINL